MIAGYNHYATGNTASHTSPSYWHAPTNIEEQKKAMLREKNHEIIKRRNSRHGMKFDRFDMKSIPL